MQNDGQYKKYYIALGLIAALAAFVWYTVLFSGEKGTALYFFNVGQGDSQLVEIGDVQILIDGGPTNVVLGELAKIMAPQDRYIDLVVMTHPQMDHFGGLIDVMNVYEVGAFLGSGRAASSKAYQELARILKEKNIPYVKVGEGDIIRYRDAAIAVLGPSPRNNAAKDANDASIVLYFKKGGVRALFTGDISAKVERELAQKYNLAAEILKVSHHGSKYSSDVGFLANVRPNVAVIGVGRNSYGHPTDAVLQRLENAGAMVARTDIHGLLRAFIENGVLQIVAER